MFKTLKISWLLISLLIPLSQTAYSEVLDLPKPGLKDTCPVCGMFVFKYPEWVATVLYKNGHAHHFDGAKDMFKYLHDLDKWAPGHELKNISSIGVTEYYGLTLIDAHKAYYVIGSDVLGPMGHELIPLATLEDAKEFLADHQGVKILRFDEVDKAIPDKLDDAIFN